MPPRGTCMDSDGRAPEQDPLEAQWCNASRRLGAPRGTCEASRVCPIRLRLSEYQCSRARCSDDSSKFDWRSASGRLGALEGTCEASRVCPIRLRPSEYQRSRARLLRF
eukprot:2087720-Alexandrium_andersonii.AAC.1